MGLSKHRRVAPRARVKGSVRFCIHGVSQVRVFF